MRIEVSYFSFAEKCPLGAHISTPQMHFAKMFTVEPGAVEGAEEAGLCANTPRGVWMGLQ